MVNYFFKLRYFFIFLFILYLSLNLTAFEIEKINTEIIVYKEGFLQIKDILYFTNVDKSEKIILPFIPVSNLNLISNLRDLRYFYDSNNLTIIVSDCCFLDNSFSLEINYFTNYFLFERGINQFDLNYSSFFKEYVSEINLLLPQGSVIISFSEDLSKFNILDDVFVLNLESVSDFNLSYKVYEKSENKFSFYFFVVLFLSVLIICIFGFKFIKKYL